MLKPFRILHYPLVIIIIIVFFIILFNLSANKPTLSSHEEKGYIRDFTGGVSNRHYLFNASDRNSIIFYNRLHKPAHRKTGLQFSRNRPIGDGHAIFSGFKYVHLDLKGAPPKVSYLTKIFPLLQQLGATGLLIEYEDMFPYKSARISAKNAYTSEDITNILAAAKENNLEVIPLLQTFGHAEFILKLKEFKHLREVPSYPQAFCPSQNETNELIKFLIDDMMELHKNISYFHIGCDEVFQLGQCSRCHTVLTENQWTKKDLFFEHVSTVAKYIRSKYAGVTPLMWDDELRSLTVTELKNSGLGELVEPIVWRYTPDVVETFQLSFWTKYSTVFKNVWIATAFKGASASDAYTVDLDIYTSNHRSWLETVLLFSKYVNFKGAILTGWQRYDHFAILCELLPVAIPSLAINLAFISGNELSIPKVTDKIRKLLKCNSGPLYAVGKHLTNHCNFPGSELFEAISLLPSIAQDVKELKDTSPYRGWMNKYNIENSFSSPSLVEKATAEIGRIENELVSLEMKIAEAMDEVYSVYTIDEWLFTYLKPLLDEVKSISRARAALMYKEDWPLRPLPLLYKDINNPK